MDLAQGNEIHGLLQQDMDNVLEIYGENSLTFRNFGGLDDIDIELHLDLHFLDVCYVSLVLNINLYLLIHSSHLICTFVNDAQNIKMNFGIFL